jgi:hypothetical protein
MAYELEWIDKNAESGPIFKIGRDVYERPRPGKALIWLKARETYPGHVAPTAIQAFTECAQAWGAPITYVIEPNLAKPPAARFLFEWSRSTWTNGSVEQSYLKTSNVLTRWMGRVVLRLFTDGAMPFEAVEGDGPMQARLDARDLSCPREGYVPPTTSTALVLSGETPPSLMRSLVRRAARRLGLRE